MKTRLAILLWATGPEAPHLCATPFFHAAAAAAMDTEVEIHCAGASVLLLVPGAAAAIFAGEQRGMSVYAHIQQAAQHGAKLLACSDALAAHGIDTARLIPEVSGLAGAAAFVERALDSDWATLVY
jgi:predicted peroxiredoxin